MAEKECIEREDAKKTMCRMCEGGSKLVCGTLNDCCTTMRIFDSIPAADVRPVVLCRDCKHNKGARVWRFLDLDDVTADCSAGHGYAELYKDLAEKNHQMARKLIKEKPHWIPVTERLPDAGESVLCYCRANIYEVMKMRTDGGWVHIDQLYDSTYMGGFVTHWMPLPEPPKEE